MVKKLTFSAIIMAWSLLNPTLQADISHRKANLTVKVKSYSDVPIEGAMVEIEMLNHAFRFGTSVEYHLVNPNASAYDATTVENLEKYFNSITYGNVMKWTYYEDRTDEQNLAIAHLPKTLNAFNSPDPLRLRGHATLWGASYQVPSRVRTSSDGAYIHEQILNHIGDYHTTFKDAGVDNYDLYNEHFHERELLIEKIVTSGTNADEAAEVATWFQKAKEVDPNAILFINEYNILNFWQEDDRDVHAYKNFVDAVRDAGGPVDGIGLQAHMDRMITKAQMLRRFDILSAPMTPTDNHPEGLPGLPIEITEYDINLSWNPTPQQQADLTDNLLEASFEHPAVNGITIWGMNDSNHWRGNGIMFDDADPANWVVKPSGQSYIDHVTSEWWEDHAGTSNDDGIYTATTFKGTHKITAVFNGQTKEAFAHLHGDDTVILKFAVEAADASTYDNWVGFINWGDQAPQIALRSADPDEDGRSNFHEYVFGTNPLAQDSPMPPQILPTGGESHLFEYTIRARHEGLLVQLAQSRNLVDWTTVQTFLDRLDIRDGLAQHTVRASDPDKAQKLSERGAFYRFQVAEAN